MYTVYILKSLKDQRTYAGYTEDFNQRFLEHQRGKVKATKNRRPFIPLYTEKLQTLYQAKNRECYWKSGGGRRKLKKFFLKGFPPVLLNGRGSRSE